MEHTRKMALVPIGTLMNQTPMYLDQLDVQMEKILKDKSIPSDMKAKAYSQALHRFLAFKNNEKGQPIKLEVEEDKSVDSILQYIPNKLLSKAKMLLDILKDNPAVSWNEKNELVYKGERVPRSNALDLIQHFVSPGTKEEEPAVGWEQLGEALIEQNAPRTSIKNKMLLQ